MLRNLVAVFFAAAVCTSAAMAQDKPVAVPADAAADNSAREPKVLSIGDKAPALTIKEWVKGSPVTEFTPGHAYVIEFWATWCGPCVEELPHFIEVSKQNTAERVRFVGLSLDMDNQVDSKVIPFLKEKAIPYPNFLLDPEDADSFITSVSEEWSGAIPATMFYDRTGRKIGQLLEPVTKEELEAALKAAMAKAAPNAPAAISTTVTTHAAEDGTVTTTVSTTKTESDGTTSSSTSTSVQKAP